MGEGKGCESKHTPNHAGGSKNQKQEGRKPEKKNEGRGGGDEAKRAEAQHNRSRKPKKARKGREKKQRKVGKHAGKRGQPQPGGGRAKQEDKTAKGKVGCTKKAPGRPSRPTRPRRACPPTHARDPGVASSDPPGEVSASTRNSRGAPTEFPIERRTVRETGRVSDRVPTRQPPQRT